MMFRQRKVQLLILNVGIAFSAVHIVEDCAL